MPSNQYGVIPIDKISSLVMYYSIANPYTWTVNKLNSDLETFTQFGGVEEFAFSVQQYNEIINLGGKVFNNRTQFLTFLNEYEQRRSNPTSN